MRHPFLSTVGLAALCSTVTPAQQLAAPFRLAVDGQPIAVDTGHAHPYLYDFDGDGALDLLVGQFGDGMLRVYRNKGSNQKPEYEAHKYFEAGGTAATVPAG